MIYSREEFQGLLTYHIGTVDLKWSKIFGIMEKAKKKYPIEDYSIGQTSLEQVFLGFAKMQKSDDD
jgi:ATP-binding cassette, subfamily A (ABC1), member 3